MPRAPTHFSGLMSLVYSSVIWQRPNERKYWACLARALLVHAGDEAHSPMDHTLLVHVLQGTDDLGSIKPRARLVERAVLFDVLEDLAIACELEHKVQAPFVVEGPVESDDTWMPV